ncbi:glycosyltransferase [Sneathiella sp.]|jgi:glycosyltransferase involved in cell wall biosynthesis|uniref:glycosyltransferase n=1 Tax=Sneathiella sp. TaxID=1964365 RepID=UPI0039E26B68
MMLNRYSANTPIRIAILVTRMDIGGVPDHIMTLLDGMSDGMNVTLITDSLHPEHQNAIEAKGIKIIFLPMSRLLDIRADIKALRQLRHILKEGGFDILHTHMSKAALLGAIIGTLSRDLIVVNTAHNLGFIAMPQRWKKLVFWAYDKIISALGIDATITVSQRVADAVIHAGILPRNRVFVIPNGIRLQSFSSRAAEDSSFRQEIIGNEGSGKIIICVARLVWFKGIETLIDAFALVAKNHPDAHLAVVGSGELEESLRAQTRQLSLEKHVHFCGERRDVPALLTASDLFVLSSVSEGLPISLLEAMAARLPIVATDVGGVSEMIIAGKTGRIVPAAEPHSLAQHISDLLANPDLCHQYGEAGFDLLNEKFSQQAMVAQTEILYQNLVLAQSREVVHA